MARKPRPRPVGVHTIGTLARTANVTREIVHNWVRHGLLPRPVGSGPGLRYPEDALLRVRAIAAVYRPHFRVADMVARFRGLSLEQLREIAGDPPPPKPPEAPKPPEPVAPPIDGRAFTRVALVPGVELHVEASASVFAKRIAAEIAEKYRA